MNLVDAFTELGPLVGADDVVARRRAAFDALYAVAADLSRKVVRRDRRDDVLNTLIVNLMRGGPRHDHPHRPTTEGGVLGYLTNALRNIELDRIKQQDRFIPLGETRGRPGGEGPGEDEARLAVETALFDVAASRVPESEVGLLRELQAIRAGQVRLSTLAEQAAGPGAAGAEVERALRQRTAAYRRAALRLMQNQAMALVSLDMFQRELLPGLVDEICASVGSMGKWFGKLPTPEMVGELDAAERLLWDEIVPSLPGGSSQTARMLEALRQGQSTFDEAVAAGAGAGASDQDRKRARDRLYQNFSRTLFRLAAAAEARVGALSPARLDALLFLIADLRLEERHREAAIDVRLDQ